MPNIIFIIAILGIVLIILRHLPQAVEGEKAQEELPVEEKLNQKGLPAVAVSKVRNMAKFVGAKAWNFLLEAKDVRPSAVAGYKIKKFFSSARAKSAVPVQGTEQSVSSETMEIVKDEQYYLDLIKEDPKNLQAYAELGKFYIDKENYQDAKDIFQYLTSHAASTPEYHARLGLSYYKLGKYQKAVQSYHRAIALDSTQPNRYYNLGRSLEALGDHDAAVTAFSQAIALEPGNERYYITLSNLLLQQGKRNEAKVTLRKGKKHIPESEALAEKLKNF